ncbi:unnamed protein product [Brachionus calyciflorus]|uniref:Potassium channel domain-containing protein n=1 Tax=Brachionus calyciflorus TaxID=104777 RepID=A0A813M2N0_9BILA|nr:unnamed protein product [Brachionus calyciflorus]
MIESSETPESNNRKTSEDLDLSVRDIITNLCITSLPHIALITIFVTYALVGAAILKEIENDKTLHFNEDLLIVPTDYSNFRNTLSNLREHSENYGKNFQTLNEKLNFIIDENLSNKIKIDRTNEDTVEKNTQKIMSQIYKKQKNNLNITEVFKSIAKHIIQFKKQLKRNLNLNLKSFLNEFETSQNEFDTNMNRLIENNLEAISYLESTSEFKDDKNTNRKIIYEWNFKRAIYFIGSLLTTLGYGDVSPNTVMGKAFIMIYLIIGAPLTYILLSDLGSIFTHILKFNYHFALTFYKNGYYDEFKRALKSKFKLNKKKTSSKLKKQTSIKDPFDESDDDNATILSQDFQEKGFVQIFVELTVNSLEKSNDKFDLSLGVIFSLVFVYLSIGALIISRLNESPLSNGYYFSVLSLTKINLGNLRINDSFIFILMTAYFLLGLAFFDLTLLTLQEKIRFLIIKNFKNIIIEVCKFSSQFGYNWTGEHMIHILENLGINSYFKSLENNQSIKAIQTIEKDPIVDKINSLKNRNSRKLRYSNEKNISKCDKQTQITTLLCSRFKMDSDGYSTMSASCSNLSDFSTSPVRIGLTRSQIHMDKLVEENSFGKEIEFKLEPRSRLKKSDRFSFESPLAPKSFSSLKSRRFN